MTEIITFSTSRNLLARVDRLRGDIARSRFISRLIEDAIEVYMKQKQPPTTTGQSLARPGQPVGDKSIQGGGPADG